jgi:hypothetical protein
MHVASAIDHGLPAALRSEQRERDGRDRGAWDQRQAGTLKVAATMNVVDGRRRGGVRRTRMAWTADRERAEWFQHRSGFEGMPGGKRRKLWTVAVGRDRLLAHYHEKHRGEDEYIIDPTGARPKEA